MSEPVDEGSAVIFDRCTTSPVAVELENYMETVSLQEPGDLQLDDQQSCLSSALTTSSADVVTEIVLLSGHDTVSIEEELIVAPSIIHQNVDQLVTPSVDFTIDVDRSPPSAFAGDAGGHKTSFHVDYDDFGRPVSTDSRELQPPTSSVIEIITDDQHDVPITAKNEQPPPASDVVRTPVPSSTNSLSKLFADDKHGTDKLGKAFFDVLAQTIITPQSSSNAVLAAVDVDSNLMFRSSGDSSTYSCQSRADGCHDEDADTHYIYSAWIPGAKTAQTLIKMASAPPATYFPEKEDLTMPGVIMTEEMKDPIRDLARQYLGEDAATQRITLTADSISQDEEGLVKLINVGCYRAAVNLTTRLLSSHGQGLKKAGHPSKNSSRSLQIWLVRLSLLLKLRLFNMAEAESEPFHGLDTPDLYYEFHPEVYGSNRRGTLRGHTHLRYSSMVPFALRTLVPQILSCVGKFGEALDRLYVVLDTVAKIEENLLKGLNENGNEDDRSATTRQASLTVWRKRHIKVLYTITNCLVAQNDFYSAYSLLDTILEKSPESEANIRSAQGHVLLQLGDIKSAQVSFNLATSARKGGVDAVHETVATSIDRALMFIAHNNFAEALSALTEANSLDANNPTVINNMAVCLLYMGRLRDSFQLLESAISATPKPFLHECVIVNVCTLYDLESSRSLQKKSAMLEVISRHAGDGFNVFCLKLQSMS